MIEPTYQSSIPPLSETILQKTKSLFSLFHDALGNSYELTYTQLLICFTISTRAFPRTILILPTQYGKSLSVALAVLMRVSMFPEKWAIVAPTEEKARIIMDYIIEHIFDNDVFSKKLEFDGTKEKLKMERSKTRITFKGGGEVRVYTADARNAQNVKKSMMGFGSPNVVLDESPLIPDDLYSTIKRMIGGTQDNFLLEIGNPWFRNHFWRMWQSPRYVKIFLDYIGALREGRYTEDYIEEMKQEAFFDVLYECHFPTDAELLANGYRQLFSFSSIENAFIDADMPLGHNQSGNLLDHPQLGVDPNRGGANFTAMTIRYPFTGFAKLILHKRYSQVKDITASIGEDVIMMARQYGVQDTDIAVDGSEIGVCDYLERKGYAIRRVLFGQAADDTKKYANAKAELYFRASRWILSENGKLFRNEGFLELQNINGKENTTSHFQIESKEDLKKRGIESPDVADSFALTFINPGAEEYSSDDDEPDFI